MAAGLSYSQRRGKAYRELKKRLREIQQAGVTWAQYRDKKIQASSTDGQIQFTSGISWGSMSNGETVGSSWIRIAFEDLTRPTELYSFIDFEKGWKRAVFLLTGK